MFVSGRDSRRSGQVAPYLVALQRDHRFTAWIVEQGWGCNWGIYAKADAKLGFQYIRKHFRTFLKVEGPAGKSIYFRYYDPRVLRTYLPTCNDLELSQVFGPVQEYAMENLQADALEHFPAPPVQVKSLGGLKIRAAQMEAFDAQRKTSLSNT